MIAVIVLAGIGYGAYASGLLGSANSMLSVGYYRNGVEITPMFPFSVIGDVDGVTDITLTAKVTNTGELPLSCRVIDTSPSELVIAETVNVPVSGVGEMTSSLISVASFEGTTPTFWVKAQCDYTYAGQVESLYKEGSLSLTVEPDPVAGFVLDFESSTGETGGGTEPDPDPEDPTCLTTGTGCVLGSDCCSNTCTSTEIVYAFANIGGPSGIFTGDCGSSTGCSIYQTCTRSDGNYATSTWTFVTTVPFGAFSTSVGMGSCATTAKAVGISGTCA